MRRLQKMLMLSLAAVALVVLPVQLAAADELPADRSVVATQAELPEDFVGATPGDANASENEYRPPDYEPNFLWGAAVGLTAIVVVSLGLVGLLYWAMVVRPKQHGAAA